MSIPLEITFLYDTVAVDEKRDRTRESIKDADDAQIVIWARNGDYAAFEELVRRYRNDVFALSYHYLRNREEAWDISQEVFIKVHKALKTFRGEASFKTWLLRITANRCKDFFKKRRLKTVAFDEAIGTDGPVPISPGPEKALANQELGQSIQAAVDDLSEKHRTAFVLREYEGLSYEEMAEVMGCSLGTVMSRLHHARKKLQTALRSMGVVEGTGHE